MASKSRIIAETQMGGHSNQTGAFDMPVGSTAQRPSFIHHLVSLE